MPVYIHIYIYIYTYNNNNNSNKEFFERYGAAEGKGRKKAADIPVSV